MRREIEVDTAFFPVYVIKKDGLYLAETYDEVVWSANPALAITYGVTTAHVVFHDAERYGGKVFAVVISSDKD